MAQGQYLSSSPSPRVRIKREPSVGDDHSSGFDSIRRHSRTNSEPHTAHPGSSGGGGGGGAGRTYESFWRDHRANPICAKILQAKAASHALGTSTSTLSPTPPYVSRGSGSGLQPPAQIVSDRDRDRRSYYNPARNPPTLTTAGSNLSTYSGYSNASMGSMVANTPPPLVAQRSMEQDAVESLMFLSSPGNSRPSSQQTISSVQTAQPSQQSATAFLHSSPPRVRHNYARNATTWPRDRPRHKQARIGLEGIGVAIRGAGGEEDDATDEDVGPDSVNERVKDGRDTIRPKQHGSRSQNISPTGRVADASRQKGEVGNSSSRGAGGRVRVGASSSSAATIRG